MNPPTGNTRSGNTRVENTGEGNQALHQGDGNQNVAIGPNSLQHNYQAHTVYNITYHSRTELDYLLGGREDGFLEPKKVLVIDWLASQSSLDFLEYHRMLLGQLVPGTGQWVLECREFLEWRDPQHTNRCLWMHGILGSGKTMLSTSIIKSLLKEPCDTGDFAVTYLYFRDGQGLTLDNILISLIKQLVQQQKSDAVVSLLKEKYLHWCHTRIFPESTEYEDMLKSAALVFTTVYLVIDALDSLPNEALTNDIIDVLKDLPSNVRVLFTSRTGWLPGQDIGQRQELAVVPSAADVRKYVKSRIQGDEVMRRALAKEDGPGFEETMVQQIISASEGMFLLTKLHMDYVGEQGSLGGARAALRDLPKNKHTTFEASIQQFTARDESARTYMRGLARHVLTWVIHARRPPTTIEVKESFAVWHSDEELNTDYMPDEVDWTSLCAGFVVFDPETQTLRLVHESVGVHVVEKGIVPQRFDLEMATICLKYLMFDKIPTPEREGKEEELFEYAACHWAAHFQSALQCANNTDADKIITLALKFLQSDEVVEASFQAVSRPDSLDRNEFRGLTGLHAATFFGLEGLAQHLIDELHVDINATCWNRQTALHWAVQYERHNMVRLLLRAESIDPNMQDKKGDTPLHLAVVWSVGVSDETVRMLMERKARLDIRGSKNQTALSWAIHYGPRSTARILIHSMENVDDTDTCEGWTPLRQAMVYYESMPHPDTGLINLLLAKGADLNTPSAGDGWTPLRHAIQNRQRSIVRRLLRRKHDPADVNLRDPDTGNSALMWALFHGSPHMADLLIDHGANVDEIFPDGSTPLIKAVQGGHSDTVWKLVRRKADLDQQDKKGRTALHYALMRVDFSLAWLLVTHGARAVVRDNNGVSVVDRAIDVGDMSLVLLFCEHGAQVGSDVGPNGLTMLHRTARLGNTTAVRFLLERGADINARDDAGLTALHHAVVERKLEVVRILSENGADMDIKKNDWVAG
ncbi:ankyrin repeat-containing domain protein [Plectosphaerella plurivora]|uniref:Ankyrin repeat-containing domain protein n=1 Tax=Plectosphaerella plurivora TaxID=936078 RepID=A0A9P9A944_9PEZI|nr:ankyrin repeat-containing domain protein [Plectosphaerella plurivora]